MASLGQGRAHGNSCSVVLSVLEIFVQNLGTGLQHVCDLGTRLHTCDLGIGLHTCDLGTGLHSGERILGYPVENSLSYEFQKVENLC